MTSVTNERYAAGSAPMAASIGASALGSSGGSTTKLCRHAGESTSARTAPQSTVPMTAIVRSRAGTGGARAAA